MTRDEPDTGVVYHLAPAARWQGVDGDTEYRTPSLADEGFIHATADPSLLLDVANHFYRDTDGDWLCLTLAVDRIEARGVRVVFEAAAPVGDTPPMPGDEILFPHIYGALRAADVVAVAPIERAADGRFVRISAAAR